MISTNKLWWASAACLLGFLAVLALVLANDTLPLGIDEFVFEQVSSTAARDAAGGLGDLTGPRPDTVLVVLVTIFLLVTGRRRYAGFLVTSALLGLATVELTKVLVARQRPAGAGDFASDLDKSFPSGHAAAGIYVFGAIGVLLILHGPTLFRLAGWGFFAAGIVVGLSRLFAGVHWVTDTIGSWFLASAVLLAAAALWRPDRQESDRPVPVAPD